MRHSRSTPPTSPAETITNVIIERLKAGVRPWRQPWTGGPVSRPLRVCGTPYRGVNVIWLWRAAQSRGFGSPTWMTYHQAELLGAQVRKGERGTIAIFYRSYTKEIEDPATGEREDEARRVLKSFTVFNVDQIETLPERFRPEPSALPEPSARDCELDAFFAAIPASLRHGGGEAYYMPSTDQITMPEVSQFRTRDLYRSTLAHELAHWTGHRSRLDRSLGGRFGSDAYAVEELVALSGQSAPPATLQ